MESQMVGGHSNSETRDARGHHAMGRLQAYFLSAPDPPCFLCSLSFPRPQNVGIRTLHKKPKTKQLLRREGKVQLVCTVFLKFLGQRVAKDLL